MRSDLDWTHCMASFLPAEVFMVIQTREKLYMQLKIAGKEGPIIVEFLSQ